MSLTGNLEDLPLLDIIQIVSFSKKTGFLTIRNSGGNGAIIFRDGNVVAAFSPESPPLDPRAASLAASKRDAMIRGRIEMALEQLIRLREGQFSFSLSDAPPTDVAGRDLSPELLDYGINAQELLIDLARGMDEDRRDSAAAIESSFSEPPADEAAPLPDALAGGEPADLPAAASALPEEFDETFDHVPPLESYVPGRDMLSGLVDDDEEEEPAAPEPPPAPEPVVVPPPPAPEAPPEAMAAAPAPGPPRTVLLVDDEADVREILSRHFRAGGWDVVDAEDPDEALKKANRLGRAGTPFLLVTDLGMPTSGGSSFQGGFEVVKRLWKMNLRPPVLMMTESLSPSLQARARQMSIQSFVFKPGLSKLDPAQFEADMKAFAAKILTLLPRLAPPPGGGEAPAMIAPRPAPAPTAARPIATAMPDAAPQLAGSEQLWSILRERLDELRTTTDVSQISQLVMRVSREFFERAALFLVKNEQMRGLGGFGPTSKEGGFNLLVREVAVPLTEPSVFLDVVASGRPFYGPLPEGRWSKMVIGRLGQFRSTSVAIVPLIANRETIALLWGDNPETGRAASRLEPLELFVTQAGISLENAFLQKKLETMRSGG